MPRTLGLDFGTKRIGAAVSDPRRSIATPLEIYERRSPPLDSAHYRALIRDADVDRIVIGLPLHTGGGEGTLAALARDWGRWISEETGLAVVFFDERYSSVDAEELMRAHGVRAKDRKARRDKLAAQILLQGYLDAGSPATEVPAAPLEDSPRGDGD